jgi:DNA-binding response OmpR family regulator
MDSGAARPHILVCDNDPTMRQIFEEILADEGYRVTVQAMVCEEIDEVIQVAPDLIVLDLMFGGQLTGIVFLQRLKAIPATKAIPVLTCTAASVMNDEIERQLKEWECDSITKPFDLDVLIAAVEKCLRRTEILNRGYADSPKI